MQRLFRSTILLLVVAGFTSNVLAAKGDKKPKGNDTPAATVIDKMIKSVTGLTEDQTKKLDALKEEYNPKLKEAYAKVDNTLTEDQKKAGDAAAKAAKADGKKGKDLTAARVEAEKITDDEKKIMDEGKAQAAAIRKELTEKVTDLLTDAQKAELKTTKAKK